MRLEVITHEPVVERKPTPLLFVHGVWHGAWCWNEHFLPYFAEHGYEAHALSLRGHGESESDKSLRVTRIRDYVADGKAAQRRCTGRCIETENVAGGAPGRQNDAKVAGRGSSQIL